MKTRITTFLFFLSYLSIAQFPAFKLHVIGKHGLKMGQTALVDLDEDNDLDWVFGQRGQMWWYEFKSADEWELHELGVGASTDVGGCPVDLNNDGKIDFMVGSGWYENRGSDQNPQFIFHSTNTIPNHDNVKADINGDGSIDIIANSNDKKNPWLVWYNPDEDWKEIHISEGIHGGVDPYGATDLDNDGDIDIVRGDAWFENVDSFGKSWKEHKVLIPEGGSRAGIYGLAIKTWCIDLDNDGDQDIVQAECDYDDTRVFWWENKDNADSFTFHLISANSTNQDFHSLAVADFDNDGDFDVFSGGGPLSKANHKSFIWENLDIKSNEWREHTVLEGYRCHEAKTADVDGDGDIDICTKPWNGSTHVFLENQLKK